MTDERIAAAWISAGYGIEDAALYMGTDPEQVRAWVAGWRAQGRLIPGVEIFPRPFSTHCKRRHRMTAANTYVDTYGSRCCRTCRSESAKASRQRNQRTRADREGMAI